MLPFEGTALLFHSGVLGHGCCQFHVVFGWLLLVLGGIWMVAINF